MTTTVNDDDRKRSVRRTALWLTLIAFAVYIGFIGMSILRGQ